MGKNSKPIYMDLPVAVAAVAAAADTELSFSVTQRRNPS